MTAAETHGHGHGHGHGPGTRPEMGPDTVFDQPFWDALYGSSDTLWSGNPNAVLVAECSDLTPGSALDIGSGEGGDAIWLAGRGWRVTGTDISPVALDRAAAHAAAAGVDVTWQHVDLNTWEPPAGSFDLVSAHFFHTRGQNAQQHRRLAAAVAPGGTLLVVGHSVADPLPRPDIPDMYFTPADVVGVLDAAEWDVLVGELRPRPFTDADGNVVTIHDVVVRARKKSTQKRS